MASFLKITFSEYYQKTHALDKPFYIFRFEKQYKENLELVKSELEKMLDNSAQTSRTNDNKQLL